MTVKPDPSALTVSDGSAATRSAAAPTTRDCGSDDAVSSTLDTRGGTMPAPPLEGARVLPTRLRDDGEIARGGMGAIHRVLETRLLRHEAMKVLERPASPNPLLTARFLEEAQITGQLDHPNIVPVYYLGFDAGGAPTFFTMKLVRGQTFGSVLAESGEGRLSGLNLERLVQILIKVCDAIAFAHSRGVVHCDLKPDNVMVGSHGQVYVMDWGLAVLRPGAEPGEPPVRVSAASPATDGLISGTPGYMAPEQAWGRAAEVDSRTDVYGIGGILYKLLTSLPPHGNSGTLAEVVARSRDAVVAPPESVANQALPPELCRIAMKALEPERERRYASVVAMKSDLEAFLRGGGWLATRSFAAGATILSEGEAATTAFVIVQGRCEAYKTVNGRRVTLREMGPGEVFGETAVLTSRPRTASVVALEDVVLKVVTRESLELELASSRYMGAFVKALAERFRELDLQLTARGDA